MQVSNVAEQLKRRSARVRLEVEKLARLADSTDLCFSVGSENAEMLENFLHLISSQPYFDL